MSKGIQKICSTQQIKIKNVWHLLKITLEANREDNVIHNEEKK